LEWSGQQPSAEAPAYASGVCELFLGFGGEARIVARDEVFEDADLAECRTPVQCSGKVQVLSNAERTITPFQWAVTSGESIETGDPTTVHVEVQFDRDVKVRATDPDVYWLERLDEGRRSRQQTETKLPEKRKEPLLTILSRDKPDFEVLGRELEQFVPGVDLPSFTALSEFQLPDFMTHPEAGLVVVIAPTPEKVTIVVDTVRSAELVLTAMLHGLRHALLGHVCTGDRYGHWDTE
jgi:hypothetical protein